MAAQAKLMAALRKKEADDEVPPPPLAPAAPTADAGKLKLKKSNLLGIVTWEEVLDKFELNAKHDYADMCTTVAKMFGNILENPTEPKYRKIRASNPNFHAKVYSCKGAPELFQLVGFKDSVEEGFLILPEAAELAPLQKALDAMAEQAATRAEAEEKKRKLEQEKAAKAREARMRKAAEAAEPAAYDAAAAGASSSLVAEDEAMIEAIEAFMDDHPELKAGREFDSYDIERQVAGPGGTVAASVVASVGTSYFDLLATMRRSDAGVWSVSKIVEE